MKPRMEKISKKLGYRHHFIVEASGMAGGIALMWNGDIQLEVEWHTEKTIFYLITEPFSAWKWCLLASYATPFPREKAVYWDDMTQTMDNLQL